MRSALFVVVLAALSGCGKEIGDSCSSDSDCDPNGERICSDPQDNEGYCTIRGCDYNTCPEDSLCVRFFIGGFTNLTCNHETEDKPVDAPQSNDCSLDELCSLEDVCVPRSSEYRFCMATCSDDGDCRDGYECRNFAKMKAHGGEPVLTPGTIVDESSPKFCAAKPVN